MTERGRYFDQCSSGELFRALAHVRCRNRRYQPREKLPGAVRPGDAGCLLQATTLLPKSFERSVTHDEETRFRGHFP